MARPKKLDLLLNIALIGLVAFFLFSPSGPLGSRISTWYAGVKQRNLVEDRWDDLVGLGARLGEGEGGITIVEFSDYECPFCSETHQTLTTWLAQNPDVEIVYRHYPLMNIHPHAEPAARASLCAEEQGKFHEMHQRLFETREWQVDEDWLREATVIGIPDLDAFQRCMGSASTVERLAIDLELADALDLRGTPSFVYKTGVHMGTVDAEDLSRFVEQMR